MDFLIIRLEGTDIAIPWPDHIASIKRVQGGGEDNIVVTTMHGQSYSTSQADTSIKTEAEVRAALGL